MTSFPALGMPSLPPTPPGAVAGELPVTVASGTLKLTPGSYGSLTVASHATVELASGFYAFENISLAEYGHVVADAGGVDVVVTGTFREADPLLDHPAGIGAPG